MALNKFTGVNGFQYLPKLSSSTNPGPTTFSFIYAPTSQLNSSNTEVDLLTFPVGEFFLLEYHLTLWNPSSDAAAENVANAIITEGIITFDSEGASTTDPTPTGNIPYSTYVTNNIFDGNNISLSTDVTGFNSVSGNNYTIQPNNVNIFPERSSSTFILKMINYKNGYKIKGLLTLI